MRLPQLHFSQPFIAICNVLRIKHNASPKKTVKKTLRELPKWKKYSELCNSYRDRDYLCFNSGLALMHRQ